MCIQRYELSSGGAQVTGTLAGLGSISLNLLCKSGVFGRGCTVDFTKVHPEFLNGAPHRSSWMLGFLAGVHLVHRWLALFFISLPPSCFFSFFIERTGSNGAHGAPLPETRMDTGLQPCTIAFSMVHPTVYTVHPRPYP